MFKSELESRIVRLQKQLGEQKLDAFVVATKDNLWYLADITYEQQERPFFIIISPKDKPVLLVPKLEERHLKKAAIDCTIISYWEYPSPKGENYYDILQDILKDCSKIAVESNIRLDIFEKVVAAEIIPCDWINEMRKVKSTAELELIKISAKATDLAMNRIFNNAYAGESILETFTIAKSTQQDLIRNKTFDPMTTSLLTVVWPAPINSMPHFIPRMNDRLKEGHNLAMCYFRINGYSAECERTFFIKKPTDEDKEHFLHMMNARKEALKILKAGIKCSDIDSSAKNYLIKKGYSNNLLHRTGHGIGMDNHEGPWIAEGNDEILKENMVISIEPGIYVDNVGGYRHSDTVLVTKDGYELLTHFPSELQDIIIQKSNLVAQLKGSMVRKVLKM